MNLFEPYWVKLYAANTPITGPLNHIKLRTYVSAFVKTQTFHQSNSIYFSNNKLGIYSSVTNKCTHGEKLVLLNVLFRLTSNFSNTGCFTTKCIL